MTDRLSSNRARPLTFAGAALAIALAAPAAHGAGPTMSACLAANESSITLRRDHHLTAAREQALVCAASTCPTRVRDACQGRVKELTAAIPSVIFEAKDATGADLTQVSVTVDGRPFADHLDGTAVAVDPGEHSFAFLAPGQPAVERRIVVYEGDRGRHERVVLQGLLTPVVQAPPSLALQSAPATAATEPTGRLAGTRVAGLAIGGVGVIGVGVGAVSGLLASSAWSKVTSACGPAGASHCVTSDRASVSSNESSAKTDGTISTVAFIAGGALVATGLVLVLVGGNHAEGAATPTHVALAPRVGPGSASVSLEGAF